MEKKKITKADIEKLMDSPEAKMFRKTLNEVLEQAKEQLKEKLKMKRKIKLRDMTKEQWDIYGKNICKLYGCCRNCILRILKCSKSNFESSWINHKEMLSNKILDMEIEIEEPDILEEVEKRYLRAVIRPFRDRVISISKYFYVFDNAYAIDICVLSSVGNFEKEITRLPLFRNEMYKGMEKNKPYTLEELDL